MIVRTLALYLFLCSCILRGACIPGRYQVSLNLRIFPFSSLLFPLHLLHSSTAFALDSNCTVILCWANHKYTLVRDWETTLFPLCVVLHPSSISLLQNARRFSVMLLHYLFILTKFPNHHGSLHSNTYYHPSITCYLTARDFHLSRRVSWGERKVPTRYTF